MSVTTETLRIVNEVVYKGKNEARQLKSDMKTTDTEVKKTGISMKQMATAAGVAVAAFGTVAAAAKTFYVALEAGAQVQAARLTFDNLTASIGSTSDAMLGELRTATSGMISDLDLMRFASQSVAMGLGSTTEEVAALAELGSTLGAAFKGDAVTGMEEFNLLLANQSIPRLDSFGISAGAVRTRIAELQAEFPDMTREAAFTQAVLEEGSVTMANLGDSTATTAANLAILKAEADNVKDAFLGATADGVNPFLTSLVNLVTLSSQSEINRDTFWEGFASGITEALSSSTQSIDTLTLGLRAISLLDFDNPTAFFESLNGVVPRLEQLDRVGFKVKDTLEEINDEVTVAPPLWVGYAGSVVTLGEAQANVETTIRNSTNAIKDQQGAFEEVEYFIAGDFLNALNDAEMATVDVEDALLAQATAAGADATTLALLAAETGNYTAEQIEAAFEVAALNAFIAAQAEALASGQTTWLEALGAIREFKAELDAIPDVITVDILVSQSGSFVPPTNNQGGVSGPFATGTPSAPGGLSMVGEFGPEMVMLPRGAQVVSTNQTHNNTSNTTINGASRRAEQMIFQYIRREARPKRMGG